MTLYIHLDSTAPQSIFCRFVRPIESLTLEGGDRLSSDAIALWQHFLQKTLIEEIIFYNTAAHVLSPLLAAISPATRVKHCCQLNSSGYQHAAAFASIPPLQHNKSLTLIGAPLDETFAQWQALFARRTIDKITIEGVAPEIVNMLGITNPSLSLHVSFNKVCLLNEADYTMLEAMLANHLALNTLTLISTHQPLALMRELLAKWQGLLAYLTVKEIIFNSVDETTLGYLLQPIVFRQDIVKITLSRPASGRESPLPSMPDFDQPIAETTITAHGAAPAAASEDPTQRLDLTQASLALGMIADLQRLALDTQMPPAPGSPGTLIAEGWGLQLVQTQQPNRNISLKIYMDRYGRFVIFLYKNQKLEKMRLTSNNYLIQEDRVNVTDEAPILFD